MTDPQDFQQIGEDYLEHFGKLGMKWGHRKNAGWTSASASDTFSGKPYAPSNTQNNEPSYVEVRTQRAGMSRNGKIATGVVLGAVGIGLVLAMSPSARKVGMNFVKARKSDFRTVKPADVSKGVKEAAAISKSKGFKPSPKMQSAGKTWAKRLFDMTQTRDTLADMRTRIPKTRPPATGVFDLKDFMPKVMSTDLARIR